MSIQNLLKSHDFYKNLSKNYFACMLQELMEVMAKVGYHFFINLVVKILLKLVQKAGNFMQAVHFTIPLLRANHMYVIVELGTNMAIFKLVRMILDVVIKVSMYI